MLRVLAPVLVLLAAASPAGAATVTGSGTETFCDSGVCGPVSIPAKFKAAPGEANDVRFAFEGTTLTVVDAGAPLKAGSRCKQVDAHTATCKVEDHFDEPVLYADLGDGDDRGESADRIAMGGGAGNDRLTAGAATTALLFGEDGDDVLLGGAGADRLAGGRGADELRGGPGADVVLGDLYDDDSPYERQIFPHPIGDDVLDGGEGTDTVGYQRQVRVGVTVDLVHGTAGQAGEHDALASIENVVTGPQNDTIIGDDGPNRLTSGRGADVVRGRGGDDIIRTGTPAVDPAEPYPVGVECGDGFDRVSSNVAMRAPADCERFVASGWIEFDPAPVAVTPTSVTVRMFCFRSTCREGLALTVRGPVRKCKRAGRRRVCRTVRGRVVIGRAPKAMWKRGTSRDAKVVLTVVGRRALAADPGLVTRVSLHYGAFLMPLGAP